MIRLTFRRRHAHNLKVEHAKSERRKSETRLEDTKRDVIAPLKAMREQNHVSELLDQLIRRRAGGEA